MIGKTVKIFSNDWKIPAVALALAVLAFLLFRPALRYDFIELDDSRYVRDNEYVTTGFSPENIRWAFTSAHEQWYLPLLWISFMADNHFFGDDPSVYHRTNILLHAMNVMLLFLVLVRMTGSVWRSAFVAALFAAHPTRVEAVAWITARKDNWSGLFFMLGLWSYAGYVEKKSPWRMVWVTLCLGLGLLSKAILVVFPACLLLLDYWPLGRAQANPPRPAHTRSEYVRATPPQEGRLSKSPPGRGPASAGGRGVGFAAWKPLILEKLPLFVLAALFVFITLSTHETGRGDFAGVPYADRFSFMAPNVWQYIGLIVAPRDLAIVYPERDILNWPLSIAAIAGLLAITFAAWWYRKRAPYLIVGWLWFLVALAPIIRGVRLGLASHADRFTYLPLIGLAVAVTWAAADWFPRRTWRIPALSVLACAVLIGCWTGARAYLPYWRDSETLFLRALDLTDHNYLVYVNLAAVYHEQDRMDEEMEVLRAALRINPRSTVSLVGMGAVLRARGMRDEAAAYFDAAARRVHPREWQVHVKIGEHYALTGRFDEAIDHFQAVLKQNPDYLDALHNIGMCHVYLAQYQEALPYFDDVLRRDPDYVRARAGRARALAGMGRLEEALEDAQRSGREDVIREIRSRMADL